MTPTFKEKVYNLVPKIPKGKVATYKQIAELCGNPKASRAVGMFMRTNPDLKKVPCYKVVASDGKLTGYSGGKGVSTKKEMLLKDGVIFKNNSDVVDLETSKWKK